MPKRIKSLREYIERLKLIGEIQEIEQEVDWNLEIGAIIRRSYDLKAPAPLFKRIKGIEPGFRVLGAPAGVSAQKGLYLNRVALSLGLEPRADGQEIIERIVSAHGCAPIPPIVVPTGPCKENIWRGEEVDLYRFPTPLIHQGDGGRYINTWGTIVVQTPDKKWTNWSIARIMVIGKNTMTGLVPPVQHIGMIHAMWKKEGKPTPFALCLGVEPAIPFVSGMPLAEYENESDFIGGFLGEPIDVVLCETHDLYVPATTEIVIEGYLSNTETAPEGPMGEYAGYITWGEGTPKPVYHVTAVTYRTDPILPVVAAGVPVEEDHTAWGLPYAAHCLHLLRAAGIPAQMCWMPFESANHWLVVTMPLDWRQQTGWKSPELIQKVGDTVFNSHAGFGIPKILLMEHDIDPTHLGQVVWAFASRCHPGIGEFTFGQEATVNLPVFLNDEEKHTFRTTKSVFNCLYHDDYTEANHPRLASFTGSWPKEIQERVLRNWGNYGYAPVDASGAM
jgi:UbiD family decarboxylase